MAMYNKFLVLSKDEDGLKNFISFITQRKSLDKELNVSDLKVNSYGDLFGRSTEE